MSSPSLQLWRTLLPVVAVWAALVALTLLSVRESTSPASAGALCIVALLTALKVALVIFQYMEVGLAPRWLQAVCSAWLVLAIGTASALLLAPGWCIALVG